MSKYDNDADYVIDTRTYHADLAAITELFCESDNEIIDRIIAKTGQNSE